MNRTSAGTCTAATDHVCTTSTGDGQTMYSTLVAHHNHCRIDEARRSWTSLVRVSCPPRNATESQCVVGFHTIDRPSRGRLVRTTVRTREGGGKKNKHTDVGAYKLKRQHVAERAPPELFFLLSPSCCLETRAVKIASSSGQLRCATCEPASQ